MIQTINSLLSILVILTQIISLILLLALFFSKKITTFFGEHAFAIAFLVAFTATIGSLFYSDIAGYEPCKLCWYQRIFIYPQTILLFTALLRKDKTFSIYILILSGIGTLIAGYHYLLQLGVVNALPCSAIGYSVSCSQRFVLSYGYITIPLMTLTGFIFIFLLMVAQQKTISYKKN